MKIYFDENYSHYVAKAFNLFECKLKEVEVIATEDALYKSASDEEVVKYVSQNSGILFTKDVDYVKAQLITELMKSYKIGLFYMKTPRKEVYWDTNLILMKAYIEARRDVFFNLTLPFYYEIMPSGKIKKMSL